MKNISNQKLVTLILKDFESGKREIALKKMEEYLKTYPEDNNTLYNYGLMCQSSGFTNKAIKIYQEVISKDDENWRALTNLYLIYFDQENYKEGLGLVDKILLIKPNHQPTLRDKAHLQYYLNNLEQAKLNILKSIKLNPKDYIALNILGMIYDKMGLFEKAKEIYLKVLDFNKNYYPTYSNLGKCFLELKEIKKALNILKKGLVINPNFINAKNNLANTYYELEMYDEALILYREILKVQPNHKDVNSNIALCYFYNKQPEETEKYFKITKKIHNKNQNFRKNYAHFLLFKQEYAEAWDLYWDSRLKINDYYKSDTWKHKMLKHIYTGNKLETKDKILIIKEQGVGDEILYSTMYPDLINAFPNCKIETDQRLLSIFRRSYDKNNNFIPFLEITGTESDFLKYDKIICAGSLGKFFRNSLQSFPAKNSLTLDREIEVTVSKQIESNSSNKKIGISWKSNRKYYGEGKSINLSSFEEILGIKNFDFYNIQYGNSQEDINEINKKLDINIKTLPEIDLMNDFEKISALLCSLDLFITVSNSTAHLAGALNVPTILIKPKSYAIFHYWSQPTNKTPWYPSLELINQDKEIDVFIKSLKNKILKKLDQ